MNNSTFKLDVKILIIALALGLMSLPIVVWAGGGGGGGGSGGSSVTGPSSSKSSGSFTISFGNLGTAVATPTGSKSVSLSGNANFGPSGKYSSTATYSSYWSGVNGVPSYVASENTFSGESPGGPSGNYNSSLCSGCTYVPQPPPPPPPPPPSTPANLGHVCSADGSSVTLRWNPSTVALKSEVKNNLFSLAGLRSVLSTRIAQASGGGDSSGGPNGLGGPSANNSWLSGNTTVTYRVNVMSVEGGPGSAQIFETDSTTVTADITQGRDYTVYVTACSRRDSCSSAAQHTFKCDPPPKLDLTANPSVVRYNNPSTLTWTSQWTAPSCQAQQGWSGNRPNQNTSGESTGNLVTTTNYRLICPAQYNFPPAIDDASVSVVSCVAGAKASTSKDLVRKGETVTLTYNTGAANPSQCVLKAGSLVLVGDLEDNGDKSASCSDGSTGPDQTYTYEVNGEVDVTFECEGQLIDTLRIKVLPEFQET